MSVSVSSWNAIIFSAVYMSWQLLYVSLPVCWHSLWYLRLCLEKVHGVHQLSSPAGDEEWKIRAGLQTVPEDDPSGQSQACYPGQQLPSSQVCSLPVHSNLLFQRADILSVGCCRTGLKFEWSVSLLLTSSNQRMITHISCFCMLGSSPLTQTGVICSETFIKQNAYMLYLSTV